MNLLLKIALIAFAMLTTHRVGIADERIPESGDKAVEFASRDINGDKFEFRPAQASKWTVLIFLRGYPEYQCPICSRQVAEIINHADQLAAAKTNVVLIYPGSAKDLSSKAQEFVADKHLPQTIQMIVDENYRIVNAYHLRWDAPKETAFPSTFIIDPTGYIRFAKISKTHGGRATIQEILDIVAANTADPKIDPKRKEPSNP
jgi:thioredoxin-dependent peroxiredoxin